MASFLFDSSGADVEPLPPLDVAALVQMFVELSTVAELRSGRFRADLPPLTDAQLDAWVRTGRMPCDCPDCIGSMKMEP